MNFSHDTEEKFMIGEIKNAKSDSQNRQSSPILTTRETRKLDLHLLDPKLTYSRKFHTVTALRRWVLGYVHTADGELNSQKAPRYEPEDNFDIDYDHAKTQIEHGYTETPEEYTVVADNEQRNPDISTEKPLATRTYGNTRKWIFAKLDKTPTLEVNDP